MASLLLVVGCVQDDLSWRDQLKAEKERQDQLASTRPTNGKVYYIFVSHE